VSAWVGAFTWLQHLRLRAQGGRDPGESADANRIDPYALDAFERRVLKEAFRQAASLQDRLRSDYRI
jgi:CBS domain-containing protein